MSGLVDPASVCLTSGGDEVRYRSYVNHRIWAAEASTDYRLEIGLGPGLHSPYDHKYAVIRTVLPRYLWTVWPLGSHRRRAGRAARSLVPDQYRRDDPAQ